MLTADDLRFFAAVTGAPTLAAAARLLNVTPPAVTQRLRALESRLGVQLLDRSTASLTDEGELLAGRSRRILAEIDDVAEQLSERRGIVAGHLRVSAPSGFGRRYVTPAIASFKHAHPDVRVTLELSDNPVRSKPDAWDVVIYIGELRPLPFQMITLAPNERILCAAPSYLASRGAPAAPSDLHDHDCLALRENEEDVTLWRFAAGQSEPETVRINPALWCNDGEAIREMALSGLGIILRSEWDVAAYIASGQLVPLLPGWSAPAAPVVALLGPRHHRAARTRNFVQDLRRSLKPVPWRTAK